MDETLSIKGKVCVTGAAGFIASWLIKRLLKSGYHVRGTVRDPGLTSSSFIVYQQHHIINFEDLWCQSCLMFYVYCVNKQVPKIKSINVRYFVGDLKKVAHLWELDGATDRLQLVRADLLEMGSFDDAVMGCEGVFHVASPVCIAKSDPKAPLNYPFHVST